MQEPLKYLLLYHQSEFPFKKNIHHKLFLKIKLLNKKYHIEMDKLKKIRKNP